MQFNFNCEEALDCDKNGFAILEGSYKNRIVPGFTLYVNEIIDKMGELSSHAQKLPTIITSSQKFFTSNHRIVFKAEKDKVLGFIKVGVKKLYIRDRDFNYHEVSPLCVLDFYVYESVQRNGIGKQLFDYMINFEKKNPKEIAYDKPSDKFLNFLNKYFNLGNFIQQNNNFVVFDDFFNYINNNLTYDNSTNRAIRLIPQNYNLVSNNNNYQQYDYNLSKSQNINNPNLINAGQNLIYNNSFDNKVINKEVYKNPISGFQQYYFTGGDTITYDNIYSKRKINLINDYLTSVKKDENQYLKEQFGNQENSIANSNGRLNQLMNKISDLSSSNKYDYDQLYNKRNQYATVFDDKKIVENNYYNQKNNNNTFDNKDTISESDYRNSSLNHIINGVKSPQSLQHYSPFSRYGKVYTNILPTTSSNYGNYYNNQDLNQREQSPNKLYY